MAEELAVYQAPSPAVKQAQQWLKSYQGAIARRLPGGQDGERYTALVMSEMQRTPKLLECMATPKGQASMMTAVLGMAQVGLEPGPLGLCYLLPFRNQREGFTSCVFLIGYKGMVQLALESTEVKEVEAQPVYEGDHFRWHRGLHPNIEHEPLYEGPPDYERLTHVYAIGRTVRGGAPFVVLSKAQVEFYRARSRAAKEGPWVTDPVPMACKTGVRRLAPWLPLRRHAAEAIAADEARDEGRDLQVDDGVGEAPAPDARRRAPRAITEPPEAPAIDPDEAARAIDEEDAARARGPV